MYDLSFILPVRIDNDDRLHNLHCSLSFIRKNFPNAETVIVEDSSKKKLESFMGEFPEMKYSYVENFGRFTKSVTVNNGALIASGKYLVIYDLDVLINPEAIFKSVKICNRGVKSFIIPHNAIFVNVSGDTKMKLVKTLDISPIPQIQSLTQRITNPDIKIFNIPSGIVFINREVFLHNGGLNKLMVSYGWEDIEVLKRMAKIGFYPYVLGKYNVIHLDHERGEDSKVNEYYAGNKAEFIKVKKMSKSNLEAYIDQKLSFCDNMGNRMHVIRRNQALMNRFYFSYGEYVLNHIVHHIKIRGIRGFLLYFLKKFGG